MPRKAHVSFDLSGKRFGRLTVLRRAEPTNVPLRRSKWYVKCDCGREKVVMETNLTRGHTRSCGKKDCKSHGKADIVFRPLTPPPESPCPRWLIEAYTDDGPPDGVAWVNEYPDPIGPTLMYVLVRDDRRRDRIGTSLILACQSRWPGLHLTEGTSQSGHRLIVSMRK